MKMFPRLRHGNMGKTGGKKIRRRERISNNSQNRLSRFTNDTKEGNIQITRAILT